MLKILDKIPYPLLIVFTIMLLAAPIRPMPHVVEKIIMLTNGTLTRPVDVFDLFFHLFPLILLIMKFIKDRRWVPDLKFWYSHTTTIQWIWCSFNGVRWTGEHRKWETVLIRTHWNIFLKLMFIVFYLFYPNECYPWRTSSIVLLPPAPSSLQASLPALKRVLFRPESGGDLSKSCVSSMKHIFFNNAGGTNEFSLAEPMKGNLL